MAIDAIVFDKDAPDMGPGIDPEQHLLRLAKSLDLPRLDYGTEGNVTARLGKSKQRVLLVHIEDDDWTKLLERLSEDRVAIRFSTVGYPPAGPQGPRGNGILCQKKTKRPHGLTEGEFRLLVENFIDPTVVAMLKGGIVPADLRGLFQFVEPRRLQAMYVLVQADLSSRGIDLRSLQPQSSRAPSDLALTVADYVRVIDSQVEPVSSSALTAALRAGAASELSIAVDKFSTDFPNTNALLETLATADSCSAMALDVLREAYRELRDTLKAG